MCYRSLSQPAQTLEKEIGLRGLLGLVSSNTYNPNTAYYTELDTIGGTTTDYITKLSSS
jgi:hypothetical protein